MKTTFSLLIFLFLIAGVNAQEAVSTKKSNDTNEMTVVEETNKSTSLSQDITIEEDMCYAELSKITFYEALIRQNGFEIELKEETAISLKNTEDIITNNKQRISYSD